MPPQQLLELARCDCPRPEDPPALAQERRQSHQRRPRARAAPETAAAPRIVRLPETPPLSLAPAPSKRSARSSAPSGASGARSNIANGKFLIDREQAVSLHVIRLQRRRAAGRVRIAVLHHRVRHVAALPSRPARAQSQIRVLAIQEKAFIEQRRSAPASRAGTARPSRWETARPLSPRNPASASPWPRCLLDPSAAISMPAESSSCVSAIRTWLANMPAFGRASASSTSASSHCGCADRVVVQRRQIGRGGGSERLIDRRAESDVARVCDQAHARSRDQRAFRLRCCPPPPLRNRPRSEIQESANNPPGRRPRPASARQR